MSGGEIFFLIIGSICILVGLFLPQKEIEELKYNPFLTVDKKFDWLHLLMMIVNPRRIFFIVQALFPRLSFILMGMAMIGLVLPLHYIP